MQTGEEALRQLFDKTSDVIGKRGGWGYGLKVRSKYEDYLIVFTAGLKEDAGKVESLRVYKTKSFWRKELMGILISEQPALNGPKSVTSHIVTGFEDEVIKVAMECCKIKNC